MRLIYKAARRVWSEIELQMDAARCRFLFGIHKVSYQSDFISKGVPQISVGSNAVFKIGQGFRINNGQKYNLIGRQQRCQFVVGTDARLTIGNHVGMSASTISCKNQVTIEDRVMMGGNVVIYDTDFHALDAVVRANQTLDEAGRRDKPVLIQSDVFIGAHSTILKGVTIGQGAIVGACSVVTKDIPAQEIWAGNPAKFIRKVAPSKLTRVA